MVERDNAYGKLLFFKVIIMLAIIGLQILAVKMIFKWYKQFNIYDGLGDQIPTIDKFCDDGIQSPTSTVYPDNNSNLILP